MYRSEPGHVSALGEWPGGEAREIHTHNNCMYRPFHMALVLMRFRCASKPNRVECASDAHWSCSHERQYLVDQLALPRLCTWLIDQWPSDTCLWSVCHRCNPPVSPSFAPLTSTTTHMWRQTSLLLASLPREGFLSCDFLSTPTFYIGDSVWMHIETTSGGDFDQFALDANRNNPHSCECAFDAHPCLHVKGPYSSSYCEYVFPSPRLQATPPKLRHGLVQICTHLHIVFCLHQ